MNTRSHTKALVLGCINKINNNSSSKNEMKREKEKEIEVPLYLVDINFDEASKDWHLNKKRIGHEYIYICLEISKPDLSGKTKVCGKKCYQFNTNCFIHRNRK
jgi:hypothetical protein